MLCAICLQSFKKTDELHATTCGHIFHSKCLADLSSRSLSSKYCPQCQTRKPSKFKIFCDFDNEENETLKTQSQQKGAEIAKLHEQVASKKSSLDESQRKRAELKKKIEFYRANYESIDWDRIRKISDQIDQEKLREVEEENNPKKH